MAIDTTAWAIVLGIVAAMVGIAWIWRASSQPGIVDKQSQTLVRYAARMDEMQANSDKQQAEIDELRRTIHDNDESYHEEMNELRAILDEWWHGMQLVFEQMEKAELVPVWKPSPLPARKPQAGSRRGQAALTRHISQRFSTDEIDGLAFEFGLAKDELAGDTRETKARALIQWTVDRGLISELQRRVEEARPHL